MAGHYTGLISQYKWVQMSANGLFWKSRQGNREEMLDKLKTHCPSCSGRCQLQTSMPGRAESSRAQNVVLAGDFSRADAERLSAGHNLPGSCLYQALLHRTQLKVQPGLSAG